MKPPLRSTRTRRAAARRSRARRPGLGRGLDAHLGPRLAHGVGVLPGGGHGRGGEGGEVGVLGDGVADERGVPDPAGTLDRAAADGDGRELERLVGDAGVEVDPAVVVGGLDVVVQVADLRVRAELGVVVRRPGCGHVAQRACVDRRHEDALADQPVAVGGLLAEQPLLEAGGEDVGDRLVERAGLAPVDQTCGVLDDGVVELVGEHVDPLVKRSNTCLLPSPKTSWALSQKASLKREP